MPSSGQRRRRAAPKSRRSSCRWARSPALRAGAAQVSRRHRCTLPSNRDGCRSPGRASLRLDERELEAVGVRERERPVSPRRVRRLPIERPALRLDARRDRVDVLGGLDPDAETLTFAAVPPLREIVLAEHDVATSGLHPDAPQLTVLLPALARREAEHGPGPR